MQDLYIDAQPVSLTDFIIYDFVLEKIVELAGSEKEC